MCSVKAFFEGKPRTCLAWFTLSEPRENLEKYSIKFFIFSGDNEIKASPDPAKDILLVLPSMTKES